MVAVVRPGDHVRLARFYGLYDHHAIYEGDGWFISLRTDERGNNPKVRRDHWDSMHRGDNVQIVEYARSFAPEHTLSLARGRLDRTDYDVWDYNCEHFARWAKTGNARSSQSDLASGVTAAAGLTAAVALGGGAAIAAAPAALASLAMAPTAAVSMGINRAYGDDATLPAAERDARSAGRTGALIGGAAGTIAAIYAVSAAGKSRGVSAGVRSIGNSVGFGSKTGIAIACALPAAAAAALAWLYYQTEHSRNAWNTPERTTLT